MTRIVIVGGGSFTWGPTFLRDIFITPGLQGSTVVLQDISPQRMELVHALGEKMLSELGLHFQLEQTTSLAGALDGADFVILTITTGGLAAMRVDLEIPEKFGIRQPVGDTVGPGGLSRTLRNIPVIQDIARQVERYCPQAYLLNYTNPLSVLTRALGDCRSVPNRTIGLCHEYIGVRARLAEIFEVDEDQVQAQAAGINHLIWITGLSAAGRDVWDELPHIAEKILQGEIVPDPDDDSPFADHFRVKATLFQIYGGLPAAGDRHLAEFFPHFLTERTGWGEQYGVVLTGIGFRQGLEDYARGMIESALRGELSLNPFMQEASGEAANQIIQAVTHGERYVGIMNLPNRGQIENLPEGAVVETFGVIDSGGAHGLGFGELPAGIRGVLERHIRNQELALHAAIGGDRRLALQVLLNDPLCSRLEIDQSKALLDELLEANRAYLPRFFDQES